MKFYLRFILLFFTFSVFVNLYAENKDEILPKTVIFKVKEEYRAKCEHNSIDIQSFKEIFSRIHTSSLEKVFPHHSPKDRTDLIDLSLIYQITYTGNFLEEDVVRMINKLKITEYTELYYLPKLCYVPNDTILSNQWYITMINAINAWTTAKGDTSITIGITDTGWDPTHPDLIGNVQRNYADPINGFDDDADGYTDNFMGWDLGNNDNDALWESTSHGVNVTGIAAATTDNITGIAGVGFNTRFLPIKISNGAGIITHAYQGIVYAADHGCDIINCSWGSYSASQLNQDVINYAVINKGCLVVAAVGNDNADVKFYPAAYKGVLSVAATEQSDLKKNNSNYSHYVDISAPGENMWTTGANGGFSANGGTSMAAPVVSGAAAILKVQYPFYTNQQIGALLQATADDLNALNPSYIDKLGSGRVNLFNGVNATNPKFVELTNHTVTDNNNEVFEFGDTLEIEGLFTNYLDPLSGLSVTVTSVSPFVNVIDGTTNLPNLSTLQTYTNTSDKFVVEVLNGAPFNEEITFKAVITNGSYTNNEYFTITINPDYINLEENLIATTITSTGKIGYNDINNSVGLGFSYNTEQLLYEAGFMVGDAITRVADVVRGTAGQDQDFTSVQNVMFNLPFQSAKDLVGVTNDSPMTLPLNLQIRQYSYAYASAPDDKYVIVVYQLKNTGFAPLNNLYAGIFADWDIDNAMLNKAGYDATRKMGYVHSLGNDTLYAAIKVLSNTTANNYSLDLDGSSGINPNAGGYTTDEKYNSLSTSKLIAGSPSGRDVAHVVSTGSFSILPNDSVQVAFAIIGGDSLLDIQTSADAAQNKYNLLVGVEDATEPLSSTTIKVFPNPTSGVVKLLSDGVIELVMVRNVLGETVLITQQQQFDLSKYPNGVYFVEVKTETESIVQKIILSK